MHESSVDVRVGEGKSVGDEDRHCWFMDEVRTVNAFVCAFYL